MKLAILVLTSVVTSAQQRVPPPPAHGGLPAVSPDGKHIAFIADRGDQDIFVVGADGAGELRLTNTAEKESAPAWDASGKHVLFSVFDGKASRLYSVDADGKNRRELGAMPARSPVLSPDGRQLAGSAGGYPGARLVVSALDGSDVRQLTDGSSTEFNAAWSPDGRRIAFARRGEDRQLSIWVVNADATGIRQLTHIPAEEGQAQWPAWSPDGRELAVQVGKYGGQENISHIWIVDASSGEARKLAAHHGYLDETPSWFPDGKRIAFQSNRTGRMEVWVMNADGSDARQVTRE